MPGISHNAGSEAFEDEGQDKGEEAGWGGRARRRQRHAITKSVEAQEWKRSHEGECRARI